MGQVKSHGGLGGWGGRGEGSDSWGQGWALAGLWRSACRASLYKGEALVLSAGTPIPMTAGRRQGGGPGGECSPAETGC